MFQCHLFFQVHVTCGGAVFGPRGVGAGATTAFDTRDNFTRKAAAWNAAEQAVLMLATGDPSGTLGEKSRVLISPSTLNGNSWN